MCLARTVLVIALILNSIHPESWYQCTICKGVSATLTYFWPLNVDKTYILLPGGRVQPVTLVFHVITIRTPVATTRYRRNIPDDNLQSDLCRSSIPILIVHFDQVQGNQESVNIEYNQFCNVYYDELRRLNMTKNGRERVRYRKPWWCYKTIWTVGKRHGEK